MLPQFWYFSEGNGFLDTCKCLWYNDFAPVPNFWERFFAVYRFVHNYFWVSFKSGHFYSMGILGGQYMVKSYDVIIIGTGRQGIFAALELTRRFSSQRLPCLRKAFPSGPGMSPAERSRPLFPMQSLFGNFRLGERSF